MNKKKLNSKNDNLEFLDHHDDQYFNILDSIELNNSTDSETTNLIDFRVVNSKNPYPSKNN